MTPLRRRRWIALFALLGLLFQQAAMATYLCPQVAAVVSASGVEADAPPCHAPDLSDPARCREHCSPTTGPADHAPALSVPAALLPATTWARAPVCTLVATRHDDDERLAAARPPPLNVRYCTLQI